MALKKQDVCVFIENEAQLQEAKELLEKYGENIYEPCFQVIKQEVFNFMFCDEENEWWLAIKNDSLELITLAELEQILIKNKQNGKPSNSNTSK